MGLHAFSRLLWRPAFALILTLWGASNVMLFAVTLNWDMERARHLDLSMLILPLVLGMIVGQTIYDLRYRFFAWTLPRLQASLRAIVVVIGLLSALIWSWAYHGLGGEMVPMAALAGYLLVFMLGAVVQQAMLLVLVALLAAGLWGDLFFGFIRAQPMGWTVLALGAAAACYLAGFSHRSSRRIPLSAHRLMGVNMFNSVEIARAAEAQLQRSARPRRWGLSFVGTEIRHWVRAAEYENHGAKSRGRAAWESYGLFGLMGLLILQPAFMDGRSFDEGLERAFHVLFSPPIPLEDPTYVPVALFQAAWTWGLVLAASNSLRREWVYPVSRRLRSLIVYRASLWQNLRIVQLLSLTFLFFGGLIIALRGGTDGLGFTPGYFRGVIAIVILIPSVQWFRHWVDRASSRRGARQGATVLTWLGILPFAGLVQLFAHFWPRLLAEVSVPVQVMLLVVLVLASQGLYYRVVTKHYQRADLT